MNPLRTTLETLFGIDLRAMATARIAIATLILLDLFMRSRSLYAFYDDGGTFPRVYLLSDFANYRDVSLHMMSGTWYIQLLFMLVAALFAGMLLIGYRTRLATIATWFLFISTYNRNPLIFQAGDTLLRMGLFWAMFLPWGNKMSVDAALGRTRPLPSQITSAATAAMLIQVALVYLGGGIHKSSDVWLREGRALYLTLNLDGFTTSLGTYLLRFPTLLRFLSRSTYLLELYGPLFLFFPLFTPYLRLFLIVAYAGFHVGIASTLKIGLFPWEDIAMLLFFLPPLFWDKMELLVKKLSFQSIHIYYDSDCGMCRKIVHVIQTFIVPYNSHLAPASSEPKMLSLMTKHNSWVVVDHNNQPHFSFDGVHTIAAASPFTRHVAPLLQQPTVKRLGNRLYTWIANRRQLACLPEPPSKLDTLHPADSQRLLITEITVIALLAYVIAWNVSAYPGVSWKMPASWHGVSSLLRINQHWGMFAPAPPRDDGWYVMPGILQDGRTVDVFQQTPFVSWSKPPSVSSTYADQYWRKYMMLLWSTSYTKARSYYAAYLCRSWNKNHAPPQHLVSFAMYFVREQTPALPTDPAIPTERLSLLNYTCPTPPQ